MAKLIFAKCVERKGWAVLSKITLKQITLKELSSPATSAIKLSGLEMLLEYIRDNTKTT